jgi:hypothetical protein
MAGMEVSWAAVDALSALLEKSPVKRSGLGDLPIDINFGPEPVATADPDGTVTWAVPAEEVTAAADRALARELGIRLED